MDRWKSRGGEVVRVREEGMDGCQSSSRCVFGNEGSEFLVVHDCKAERRDVYISLAGGKILF